MESLFRTLIQLGFQHALEPHRAFPLWEHQQIFFAFHSFCSFKLSFAVSLNQRLFASSIADLLTR